MLSPVQECLYGESIGDRLIWLFTGEDEVAKELEKKVRVLCWVMTGPANHQKKAIHVQRTWGKRCNVLLFMSSKEGIY